jgi:hypothetical protein
MRTLRRVIFASIGIYVLLGTNGCGSLYYMSETDEHKIMRQSGYELCHLQSCGPEALSDAFSHLGISEEPFEIGKEIQDLDHSHYRAVMSLIHHDFSKITCPPELTKYCKYRGFKVEVVTDIDDLRPHHTAIVLLRGRDSIQDWHWICYPEYDKATILGFFDDKTIFKKAYILSR